MNVIDLELLGYLQTAEGMGAQTAASMNALPIYRGWYGTVYLTTGGEFLFRDEESVPPEIRPEHDEHVQIVSLVEGSKRFPLLANVLPSRALENEQCAACDGTGRFSPRKSTGWVYCAECHGLGWRGRIRVPLQIPPEGEGVRYPAFDDAVRRFERFVDERGLHGNVVFVPRKALTLMGQTVFIARGDAASGREAIRQEYNASIRKRLGVSLNIACRLPNGDLVAYLYGPTDLDEALRLMYPDGVKNCVPVQLPNGIVVGRFVAIALRLIRRHSTRIRDAQDFLK